MPIAFKEWAVTVRALAEGEQLVTLRKGGIREEQQALRARARPLLPLPDVRAPAQRRRARLPPAGAAARPRGGRLARRRAAAHALTRDGGIPQPDRVRIRAWAEVADHFTITDPRVVDALSPYYVWTTDYAEKRLSWKRRHPLHVLLLRTYRIPRPVTVQGPRRLPRLQVVARDHARPALRGHAGPLRRRVRSRPRADRGDLLRRRARAGLSATPPATAAERLLRDAAPGPRVGIGGGGDVAGRGRGGRRGRGGSGRPRSSAA